ncbi:MAG: hypothetical protein AVDCRST_MAG78-2662 [uncultured Rubrobacteraceae bacterium]|uniref:Uncharacterized protein n=1 Tax=uncultured Rubrobacteraceae bacterium TaxID=349277 RepID=A0A6J4QFM4_9ACTN|nr:MAG: hypothetical protein AVDCRST_MAG78-2662 [uncultured Rubrobacteraceae bacterium]
MEGSRLVFVMVKVTGSPGTALSGYAVIFSGALCVFATGPDTVWGKSDPPGVAVTKEVA